MNKRISVNDILEYLKKVQIPCKYYGTSTFVSGFSSLSHYQKETITWCKSHNNIEFVFERNANVELIITPEYITGFRNQIVVDQPRAAFFLIIKEFFNEDTYSMPKSTIGVGTYVEDSVVLGENVRIGCNCSICGNVYIGDNTIIFNNVVILNNVSIGSNCIIHSGSIIGHDDFSYIEFNNQKIMITHHGGVVIGNDVFIGAGCVINRGTLDDTIIGNDVKIDAQCHISHNTIIGDGCAFVSGTRIYGSVKVGDNVYIATSTIKNGVSIGDGAIVGMNSTVMKNVDPHTTVVGSPAKLLRRDK